MFALISVNYQNKKEFQVCIHISQIHWDQKRSGHLGFQFSDIQLKSFVDPKPVELWESAIHQKFCLSLLVWLQK